MSDVPQDGIAIVGMSGRFPGSPDIGTFWQALLEGREGIARFTEAELLAAGIPAEVLRQPNYVRAGACLDEADLFDAAFFGISPREAELMDPQQRLFLEHAWLALEDAGVLPERFPGQIAVFGGASFSTYGLLNLHGDLGSSSALETVLGNDKDYLATRVSYKLGLRGPSIGVQTACSTSLTAVALACDSLLNLQADVALAGGVTVKLPLKAGYLYEEGSIASPDGYCRTFDARAQGTVFGSGVGVVALKRLEDALAEGDTIHAVIRGWSVNNDGARKVGFTAPSVEGQARVIAAALAQAGVAPETIGYVEAHGTATPIGDPIEVRALTQAYGASAGRARPCGIGSVKTNVGHLESAAGVTGLIKVALAVKHGVIPPSLHFEAPNPEIDFARTPFRVVTERTEWAPEGAPRRAGLNSFGMGGTNVHVIVEEPPARPVRPQAGAERSVHLVPLSARSEAGLREAALRLADRLAAAPGLSPGLSPGDVAHTMAGRQHFPMRLAVQGRDAAGIEAGLRAFAEGRDPEAVQGEAKAAPDVAFLFTGQGAQYAGMAAELHATSPAFRATLDRCSRLLEPHLGRPLLDVLFPAAGDEGLIDETIHAQPALFSVSYALAELWRSWGVAPRMLIGHSLGEYAAAVVAGVFSLEDGLALVAARGRLMQALPRDGVMMTVFAGEAAVREALAPHAASVSVAAVNGPASTVVSGARAAVEAMAAAFGARGVKVRPLATSHAFHSPLMQPVLAAFRAVAEQVRYRVPELPVLSNVTGRLERERLAGADYWCEHIMAPVRFMDGIRAAVGAGVWTFVEMGPRPVLCALGREAVEGGEEAGGLEWLPSLTRAGQDWATLAGSLGRLYVAGAPIDWSAFDKGCGHARVALPGYPFQRRRFWTASTPASAAAGPARGVGTGAGHPLLGQRLRQAGTADIRFEAEIAARSPAWLDDHRVFDAAVLPAAAYLEMALAGGARLLATELLTLEGVRFRQALTLPEGERRIVQTVFSPQGPREFGFRMFSGDEAGEAWTLHCDGTVKAAPAGDPPGESLEVARARCDGPVQVDFVYASYRARGLGYGPAFRGIRALSAGPGETLAHIVLPEPARDGEAYRLHPALTDACFQALGAAFGARDDRDTFLPVTLDRLTLHAPVPAAVSCHARLLGDAAHPGDQASTLRLFDEGGRLVAEMAGLQSRRVTREVVLQADALDNWLYETGWEAVPPLPVAGGQAPGAWAVLGDGGAFDRELAEAIAARGGSAVLLAGAVAGRDLAAAGPFSGVADLRALPQPDGDAPVAAERAAAGLLELAQALAEADPGHRTALALVTRGAQPVLPEEGVADLAGAASWGLMRTVWHEFPGMPCLSLDLDPARTADAGTVAAELCAIGGEQQVALRGDGRFVARLRRHAESEADRSRLELPATPYRIERSPDAGLDRLEILPLERRRPEAGEVELEVVGMGLNFRDVLSAMGLYPGDAGPFGGECSGRVLRVGPDVAGLAVGDEVVALHYGLFASHVTLPAAVVFRKPAGMPLVHAAGLPIVQLTAWYGLSHLARIKAGDRVLIHSATGGVGIAAIRIAQMAGAEILATASPHKHALLREMGIRHVMNSRTIDFAGEVMAATGGQGVDIVLNSLGGEAIPAGLSVVRPGGFFVEIGKRDIWSAGQAREERSDIGYAIVNFDETATKEPELVRRLLGEVLALIGEGRLAPPLTTVHPAAQALDAMRLMQKANHVGKLVLAAPEPGGTGAAIRSDAAYLVTGAFGGIGRLVSRWLVEQGARHLALAGRTPPDGEAEAAVAALRGMGAEVAVFSVDVGDRVAVDRMIAAIDTGPAPLRGIVHAAGVLDDGILTALDRSRIASAFAGKVHGAWHLHEATRARDIDLFVLFSSLGSLLGAPGQANYAAANAFLDGLAHRRRALGLRALTVNWGGWSETGMAAGRAVAAQLSHGGAIPPEAGLRILGRLMRESAPEVAVVPFAWPLYFEGLPRRLSLLAEVERDLARQAADAEKLADLRATLRSADDAAREAGVLSYLHGVVARLLRLEPGEAILVDQPLAELGLDSLVSIQLRNRIRTELDIDLPAAELIEAGSLGQIAAVIGGKVAPGGGGQAVPRILPLGRAEAPLSFAQQRLWFLTQADPHSAFYTVTFSLFLEGRLDPTVFEAAFRAIAARHGALRTSIHPDAAGAEPVQRVAEAVELPIEFIDLSGLDGAEHAAEAGRLAGREAAQVFDLAHGPLARVTLLRLGEELHRAIVAMHHVIVDGWSVVVLVQEFGALYRAMAAGRAAELPALPVQYADFAVWQRDWLAGPRLGAELAYWTEKLAGPPPALELPTDRPRAATARHRGGSFNVLLPRELADGLKALGHSLGTGLFAVLLGGFQILLHRLTGADDVSVGSLVANRDRPEIEGLIGFFANMVVFRSDLSGDPSVRDGLARVAATVRDGLAHQDLPFDRLVEELNPPRAPGRNPLCDIILVLQRAVPAADLDAAGLRIAPLWDFDNGTVRFDLEVHVWELEPGLSTSFIYDADLFDRATIEQIQKQFAHLLQEMIDAPGMPISRLALAGDAASAPAWSADLAAALSSVENLSDEEVEALLRGMGEAEADRIP